MLTDIDCVVAPFDQRYEAPALDASVWLVPAQIITDPAGVIVGLDGKGLTVTTAVAEGTLWHPPALVTRTVKFPLAVTVMLRVIALFDQR